MSKLDSFRRQAKQLVRWHREGHHSVGGRIRSLPRYRELTDVAVLTLRFPLAEAQEIVARENGYESWASLKAAVVVSEPNSDSSVRPDEKPFLKGATPVVFVSSVQASATFFRDKLGFRIDFLHGNPPFYGSVSRDGARLHLRFVHESPFVDGLVDREQLICAFIEVEDVKSLYAKYVAAGVEIADRLKREPWGGSGFTVRDPDGNRVYFVSHVIALPGGKELGRM
ncbi:MAG: glyoxalase superfamily protein [Steroidobacteraceae bacterium]